MLSPPNNALYPSSCTYGFPDASVSLATGVEGHCEGQVSNNHSQAGSQEADAQKERTQSRGSVT